MTDKDVVKAMTLMARSAQSLASAMNHGDACFGGKCFCGVGQAEKDTVELWGFIEALAQKNSMDVDAIILEPAVPA